MLKKLNYIILMSIFLIPMFIQPLNVSANGKRLRDLLENLDRLEQELKKINNDKNLTESRINQIIGNVERINNEVVSIEKKIVEISNEIEQLNQDIIEKEEDIKKLVNFLQLSAGENAYLEYAFGAATLTDFIYRLSIVEQLTKHNDKLINDMNEMIESQKQNQDFNMLILR